MDSKAFYAGVLVDQIMKACNWKRQNTFTNFLPKRPDLVNDKNVYLGPLVGTRQVIDSSPHIGHPHVTEPKK